MDMIPDEVIGQIEKEIRKREEIGRKKVLYYTPQMYYVELLLNMPDNVVQMYEFHIIKEAGLLPKLKYVYPIAENEDDNKTTRASYIFDTSITWDEFKKVVVIANKTKYLDSLREKHMEVDQAVFHKIKSKYPNEYVVMISGDEFGTINPDDILNVKSIKHDLLDNPWGLIDEVPTKDFVTEIEKLVAGNVKKEVLN
jgi:hypothetical protein